MIQHVDKVLCATPLDRDWAWKGPSSHTSYPNPNCEHCMAHLTCGDEMRRRLAELSLSIEGPIKEYNHGHPD